MSQTTDPSSSQARPSKSLSGWLVMVYILLLAIPVGLVVYERWFDHSEIRDILQTYWCKNQEYCPAYLPSYFLIIFASYLGFAGLFYKTARPLESIFVAPNPPIPTTSHHTSPERKRSIWWLFQGTAITVLTSLIFFVKLQRLPSFEILIGVLLVLAAFAIEEQIIIPFRQIIRWLFWGAGHLIWLLFLRSLTIDHAAILSTGLLTIITAGTLIWLTRPPLIYWITWASMGLMTFRLWGWEYSVIGDEYSFYSLAIQRMEDTGFWASLPRLFDAEGVYGTHPFLSTLIQMAFMSLFGQDNFGWRISNIYLTGLSIGFFYLFYRSFLKQQISLWAALLLTFSHYLFNFSKIGYNNLQALFTFGVLMAAVGHAFQRPGRFSYALVGAASGICFYVYPAALYALPIAVLWLVWFDFPKNSKALKRWLSYLLPLIILLLPLMVQPTYWQTKIAGTFFNPNSYASQYPLAGQFIKNSVYSLFSFLYSVEQSHFVVVSHLDPFSAMLLPIGMASLFSGLRQKPLNIVFLLSYIFLLFLVGATHDRAAPSNTRMFMMLPFYAMLTALGLAWCFQQLSCFPSLRWLPQFFAAMLLSAVLIANSYMAYHLYRYITRGVPSLEVLVVRLLQRDQTLYPHQSKTILFLTDPNWDIEGIQTLAKVYRIPPSQVQLLRYETNNGKIPPEAAKIIREPNTRVIIQPWIEPATRALLADQLLAAGKKACLIQDTPFTEPRFTLYVHPAWWRLCPQTGNWDIFD